MIEKKIYYYWNTDNLPRSVEICIESWKHFMPDYKIERIPESYVDMNLEWNQRAFNRKYWSCLSDTARINFLKTHSGIYLDTDMIAIKRFPDELLNNDFIIDRESETHLNNAIIGKANTAYGSYIIEKWYNVFKTYTNRCTYAKMVMNRLRKSADIERVYFLNKNFAEILVGINNLDIDVNYKLDLSNSVFLHMNTSIKVSKRKNQEFIKNSVINYLENTSCDKHIIELFEEYHNLIMTNSTKIIRK